MRYTVSSLAALIATGVLMLSPVAAQDATDRAADLAKPELLQASQQPIIVDGDAAPFLADIDGDGRRDLLVGQYHLGRLRIYRNVGTDSRPAFGDFTWFRAAEEIACIPAGCNVGFSPHLADFNGDGLTDMLSGSFESETYVFPRLRDGSFGAPEIVQDKHGEVQMRRRFPNGNSLSYNSTACAHDWNGDGAVDLILGRTNYCIVLNERTNRRPVFGEAQPILVNGNPIGHGVVGPCVADWDGDGLHDLIAGQDVDIVWYRNVGQPDRPQLTRPEVLVKGLRPGPLPAERPGYFHAICVTDFDRDGHADLLVGDEYRQFPKRPVPKPTEAELAQRRADYVARSKLSDEYRRLRRRVAGESPEERVARFQAAIEAWRKYAPLREASSSVKRTGRVWLYRRIPTP